MGVTETEGADRATGAPELQIIASTGSTNDDVMELGRGSAPHGACIAAHEQTAGRGRRGHGWGSPSTGLYLSVLLRPDVPMSHYMGISAVCGMGVLDALRSLGATRAALKWPNDVVVPAADASAPDRKLAGILVEAGTGDSGMFAVCGIGVNLERPVLEDDMGSVNPLAPAGIADAMAEGAVAPGFDELAQAIRDAVVARADTWAAAVNSGHAVAGPLAPVLSEYFDALSLMGSRVDVVYPNGNVAATGDFVAVDVWGRATVRLGDGREVVVSSEQASLRRAAK
ncbi:biotin--[acetyl-CoA-carboxylase] ligase [uncultured Parolsenella sp.]|uniref:biotin--[acetyl-CoA-carboxylase] ligase n=1 Tax=uncultured Parolsenella sp. TaxID=2083008 RepID=UPI0026015D20|nr:biotin--[acetyl-CoA-carboxylase] ligase [uncultured Parolsenella sp.]